MRFPRLALLPGALLAVSVPLSGCGCGSENPSEGVTLDSTLVAPSGSYGSGDARMHCDSARHCVLTFPDAIDSATWTVEFDLVPGETKTDRLRRSL